MKTTGKSFSRPHPPAKPVAVHPLPGEQFEERFIQSVPVKSSIYTENTNPNIVIQPGQSFAPPVIYDGQNSIRTLDSRGQLHDVQPFGVSPSHILTIDSRDRDRSVYKSPADFVVKLPFGRETMVSIELLEAIVPILSPDTIGNEPYIIFQLELEDSVEHVGICHSLSTRYETDASAPHYHNPVSQNAFGHFLIGDRLNSTDVFYVWRSNDQHRMIATMPKGKPANVNMRLRLMLRTDTVSPIVYPLDEESGSDTTSALNNVFYKFEVVLVQQQ